MKFLALLGLLAFTPQEEAARRAEPLIQQLDSDSPDEREAAEKALLEGGAEFEPFLEKASRQGKPEVRARCRDLLKVIALEKKRRESWAPAKPITTDFKETPLKEALDRISKLTGYALAAGDVNKDARVTLALRNATFLQALEAVCLSMGCWYRWDGTSVVLGKAEAGHSRSHAGPLMLTATLGSGHDSEGALSLDFRLEWDPGLRIRWCEIEIDSAEDDLGGAVSVAEAKNPAGYVHRTVYSRSHRLPREGDVRCFATDGLNLTELSKGATSLKSVKGRIVVYLPEEARKMRFDKKDAPVELGAVTATLRDLSPTGSSWGATIDLDLSRTPPARHRALFAFLLNSKMTFVRGDAPGFVGDDSGASSGGSLDDPLTNVGRGVRTDKFADGAGPTAIEATIVTDVWEKSFPFEFKDVRKPDAKK